MPNSDPSEAINSFSITVAWTVVTTYTGITTVDASYKEIFKT